MSSPKPLPQHPISPPPAPASPPQSNTISGGVRRYHTISAHSRPLRNESRVPTSQETAELTGPKEDEYVAPEEWVTGVGAVGENNSSLHRQASLPTRYNVNRGVFAFLLNSVPATHLRHDQAIRLQRGPGSPAHPPPCVP